MASFVYRCPNTGLHAHAWVDAIDDDKDQVYVAVPCDACQRLHLINAKTGKLIADGDG